MSEDKKKAGLHPEEFFGNLLVNILMRFIGMIMRLIIIIVGLIMFLVVLTLGIIAILIWTLLPLVIPFLMVLGLKLIFLN